MQIKKILLILGISAMVLSGCASTDQNIREVGIQEEDPSFVLENINSNKKPLEEIIVFNQKGVTIRKEGNNLVLSMPEAILFDFDKSEVKDSVKDSLNILGKALTENKDIKIKINGHTDFIGTDQYNLGLSVKRANAIKNYLAGRGVSRNNISIEGYGKQSPVASNATSTGRAQNRRVEFIISRNDVVF
ncbi:OmpA family protein [Fusobacterium sp.]|uniref:OmpA family protein n=1 Tax=Fusobacterium sp. TaxID=68766 RepID=UPI00396C569A